MNGFHIFAGLLAATAITGIASQKIFKMPGSLGMAVSGAAISGLAVLLGSFYAPVAELANHLTAQVNFTEVVFHGMLSFILFAGAMHVDLRVLARWKLAVGLLATVGVLISTVVVAGALWALCHLFGYDIPFTWLLVFGALISPTDPISVLSLLKEVGAPKDLETKIAGESLLNDGCGIVLFSILLAIATSASMTPVDAAGLFVREALGGVLFGLLAGVLGHVMLRWVDHAPTEILITLSFALGGFLVAEVFHVSAPLATAMTGLIIGHGKKRSMSEETRSKLLPFWEMLDEGLNMALFALVGLALISIPFAPEYVWFAVIAIVASLLGRAVSVAFPLFAIRATSPIPQGTMPAMIWGGLRGGLSLAMVLSLPVGPYKDILVMATWAIVMFSLLVQAPTMKPLLRKLGLVGAA